MTSGNKKNGKLTPEDMALWRQIADAVKPLHKSGKSLDVEEALADLPKSVRNKPPLDVSHPPKIRSGAAPYYQPMSNSRPNGFEPPAKRLDDKTVRRLRKGKLDIDATIDLHGMVQMQAHRSLINFIEREQLGNSRMVLVITGKGKAGQGVLRDAVPRWLAEHPLRSLVSGWRSSHLTHGGDGALYVRLKKRVAGTDDGR